MSEAVFPNSTIGTQIEFWFLMGFLFVEEVDLGEVALDDDVLEEEEAKEFLHGLK